MGSTSSLTRNLIFDRGFDLFAEAIYLKKFAMTEHYHIPYLIQLLERIDTKQLDNLSFYQENRALKHVLPY